MGIFDRLQPRITDKADNLDIPIIPLSRLSVIQCLGHRIHIHRVLVRLRSIDPFRSGDSIQWRGEPTPEQKQLLQDYEEELVAALTPRALSDSEATALALWTHDIGETKRPEREKVVSAANGSPAKRVAVLWMADGSPETQPDG